MSKHKSLIIPLLAGLLIIGGCSTNNSAESSSSSSSTPSSTASSTETTPAETSATETSATETAATETAATETAVAEAADDTGLTQQVTQGPFYVTGTNELTDSNLNYDDLTGEKIKVQGYVYAGATGTTPVAGAKVDIWHADDSGNYLPNGNGEASTYSTDEISLRGFVMTDENGYYEYTSIYPGEYSGRTRHIHTNTTADGYKGVITQLIIPSLSGDQMTAAQDNIAQSLPAYNKVTFTTVDGVPTTTFNYRIAAN